MRILGRVNMLTLWCRGAVLSRMPDDAVVTSFLARRHYGVEFGPTFGSGVDLEEATSHDDSTDEMMASRVSQARSYESSCFSV